MISADKIPDAQALSPSERKILVALALLEMQGHKPSWRQVTRLAGVGHGASNRRFANLRRRKLIWFSSEVGSLKITERGLREARRRGS